MNLFLGSKADRRAILVFGFATVGAAVGKRLCLEAVVADIAEIVGHGISTSLSTDGYKLVEYCCVVKLYRGILYIVRVFLNAEVIFNTGDSRASDLTDVLKGDDSCQLFFDTNSFLRSIRHDF